MAKIKFKKGQPLVQNNYVFLADNDGQLTNEDFKNDIKIATKKDIKWWNRYIEELIQDAYESINMHERIIKE